MNNVKKLRFDRKWSQDKLASLVHTSQQQIQRIETGAQAARLPLAMEIASALNEPIEKVFPGVTKALGEFAGVYDVSENVASSKYKEIRKIGIEPDPKNYTLKVLLRGHQECFYLKNIPAADIERFNYLIQFEEKGVDECSFVVFESDEFNMAINLRSLAHCHFLIDADPETFEDSQSDEMSTDEIDLVDCAVIYFTGKFEPTYVSISLEEINDGDDATNYLNHAFNVLEVGIAVQDRIYIRDFNGEVHYVTAGDISFLKVPHRMLESDTSEYDGSDIEFEN